MLRHFSPVWLCVTLLTVTCHTPLSMGFSRQEFWSWFPCPPPGDLPKPVTESVSLMSPALASGFFNTSTNYEVPITDEVHLNEKVILEIEILYKGNELLKYYIYIHIYIYLFIHIFNSMSSKLIKLKITKERAMQIHNYNGSF